MDAEGQHSSTGYSKLKLYNGGIAILVDLLVVIAVTYVFWRVGGITVGAIGALISLILVLSLSIRVVKEWNRMPVLRLGKYKGVIGPGLFLILPLIESTPASVDTRVISTTFNAEKTLTKDNVPVDVDAILFWQVNNTERSVLSVQDYRSSVLLASQTAMRDIIGKEVLSMMLAGRDIIGKDVQDLIQERVGDWGIKAISVEIRDVKIPDNLQDAMARVATSMREKDSRVILAESESLAADKMIEASRKYETDPYAMQLRALNMMYEISLTGKNVMVFIPTQEKGLSLPIPFGVDGINEMLKKRKTGNEPKDGK